MKSIRVSENRRFLERSGEPFFYLADTAWELFHRITLADADHYLNTRSQQGFNVIQAVILAEFDGLHAPNANGDLPLSGDDPSRPNEKYFQHVDKVIRLANRKGLTVALLPTWGDKVNKKWGVGPEIFTPENARVYGEFLGRRYKDADLIWVLGGDRPIETDLHHRIWDRMAYGLHQGDGGAHLHTFHPMGGQSSSEKLHSANWLDFNMLQSGHGARVTENFKMIGHDYQLQPTKPCLDGEPNYEDHPVNWHPQELGWFGEYEVRRAAYWSVFAGACGHTYGCHDIWQFWESGREPVAWARTPWNEALELPGAKQMKVLRDLLLEHSYFTRIPDQSLVKNAGEGAEHVSATRCSEGSFALVYFPVRRSVELDLSAVKHSRLAWISPRDGARESAALTNGSATPPTDEDWILEAA